MGWVGGCKTERGGEDENMGKGAKERERSKVGVRKSVRGGELERGRGREGTTEREDDFCSKCGVMAELIALSRG